MLLVGERNLVNKEKGNPPWQACLPVLKLFLDDVLQEEYCYQCFPRSCAKVVRPWLVFFFNTS